MKTLGILSIVVAETIWRGYALSKLWLWFIVATFGAASISVPQAAGLSLIVTMLTYKFDDSENAEFTIDKVVSLLIVAAMMPAMFLLVGWIIKGFLG
jgi:hypothetical protein